jgi:ectoine hydroxylase-related dioxygenase (phytanoyl-CoA dioxygenase family)
MAIVESLKETYEEQGFVSPVGVFSDAEISAYREAFDALEEREGKEKCQIGLQSRHFDQEFIWQLATEKRVVDVMQTLMGEDVMLLSTHFFCKYPDPESNAFVAWHQDITYWGLEPPIAHTAWIAIDDADVENGCMRFIPGSQKAGIAIHDKSTREGNLLSINQEIPGEFVNDNQAVDVILKAGQMSVHDGQLFHASNPNRSTRRRCALTVRFIPPNVKQAVLNSHKQSWQPIILRGEDRFGHFGKTNKPFALQKA